MGEIIFAKTRYHYDSYMDYFRLAELSGFPIVYVDQIDLDSDNVYIFSPANGETLSGFRTPHRAKVILHQLEWNLDGGNTPSPGIDEIWSSDPSHAAQIGARYVMLGSHPDLNLEPNVTVPKEFDVIMLSYLTPRRQQIRHDLLQCGVTIAGDGWGQVRHENLQRSRLVIHVHQHDNVATLAPQRWALAAAYHLPILTEATTAENNIPPCFDTYYDRIVQTVKWYKDNDFPPHLTEMGATLYHYLCIEHPFRKEVEAAV